MVPSLLALSIFSLMPQVVTHATSSVTDQIHLSWTGDPTTTITIVWHTPSAINSAQVEYGPSTDYGYVALGTTFASSGSGYLHQVNLEGLQTSTTYHYAVSADDGSWSRDYLFTTAPAGTGDFSFIATGDMGRTNSSIIMSNTMTGNVPAFTVGAGDYWYSGGAEARTDEWFNISQPLFSEATFMPSRGNHEVDKAPNDYFTRFALPQPETYYSFQYGGAHFLIIDTNQDFSTGSPQRSFIESDLQTAASDPSVKWTFAVFHHPPFASSSTFQNLTVRQELSPLFDRWGVDMVVTGHAHFYERTFPVRSDGTPLSTDSLLYVSPGAPIYVITGGGGADPRSTCSANKQVWSVTCQTVYEFLKIHVTSSYVQVATIGIDGKTLDGFTLMSASVGDTVVPSQPQNLTATARTAAEVDLSWEPSVDNVAMAGYDIYRDAIKIDSAGWWATGYSDITVTPSTTHTYTVVAFDSSRNPSEASNPLTITTPKGLIFTPTADATVRSDSPSTNYGQSTTLQADASPVRNLLVSFSVKGVGKNTVVNAELRLFVVDSSPSGGIFYNAPGYWTESTVNWNNAPATSGGPIASLGAASLSFWYKIDVSQLASGDGTLNLMVTCASSDGVAYSSKEGLHPPQLIVTLSN